MPHSKRDTKNKQRTGNDMTQLGIFSIPDMTFDNDVDSFGVGDDDLEAELLNIISTDEPAVPKKKHKDISNLDKMVAESMKDIPSDASLSDDEDDPSLLAELRMYTGETVESVPEKHPIVPITNQHQDYTILITERINMYKEAEINANSVGDISKARRIGRGLKTLNELLKKAQSGFFIKEEDIPLPISVAPKKPPEIFKPVGIDYEDTPSEAPVVPPRKSKSEKPEILANEEAQSQNDEKKKELLSILCERRDEYRKAAVIAKRSGNTQTALAHVKIIKQFDAVIVAAEEGQPVDISTMPPHPFDENLNTNDDPSKSQFVKVPAREDGPEVPSVPEVLEPVAEIINEAPLTVLEALEQRLNKFLEQEETGKKDGNMSKVRRMGRIVKQYQDAIKLHKAGKPIPVDELPTPPGFPPIPVETAAPKPSPIPSPVPQRAALPIQPLTPDPPSSGALPKPDISPTLRTSPVPTKTEKPQDSSSSSKTGSTRIEKQLNVLRSRQKQYKEAALIAKKSGNITQAKEYLRLSKCFDPLIEASLSGFPVDMSTLPSIPENKEKIEKEYEIIKHSDCIPGSTSEIYNQIIFDLQKQIQMCMETRSHFKAIGDIGSSNQFEQLAVNTKKDLDTVKIACNKDDPVPRFHYEKRHFSIVRCNVDLNDNEFELNIIQGINYNVPNPKEIDTYVRFELPFPTDCPYKDKTQTVYNTNNPVYRSIYKVECQRSNRSFQRIFKRQSIKFEVWSKGGFFRSDSLLGTVALKLQPLETKCTIHDSFDLMDGRKTVGGKLEIKVRLRNPIAIKQIEKLEEKWLVID